MEALLTRLADSVTRADDLETLARPLLEMLQTVTGLESTYLTTVDLERGEQRILYANNSSALQIPEGLAVDWGDTLCKRALEEGRMHTDAVADCWGDSGAARELGINTYASAAVRTQSGGLYGTLCAASASSVPLTENAGKVLAMFSTLIAQHVERETLLVQLRRANSELSSYALTDALTGLPNRRALILELSRALARARREGSHVHVAFIDLDGFKAINDRHGHAIGDRFLMAMAARLADSLRGGDLVARLGGDEFVVVAPASPAVAPGQLREHLGKLTAATFNFNGISIEYRGASVGIIVAGTDNMDAEAVLVRADAAMYEVKRARKQA